MSEKPKVEFKVSIGDFWKKIEFTKVPESYWDVDTWDNDADLLDYEDEKRFIFVSKLLGDEEDASIQYQLIVKKIGKKLEPIGVVAIDDDDEDEIMLLLFPNEKFYMFLQYFGRGDIVDNLLASGFITGDEDDERLIGEAEPVVDELTLKKNEHKSLFEILKVKKAEFDANKTKELKKEVLKIKADLDKLLPEIKALEERDDAEQKERVKKAKDEKTFGELKAIGQNAIKSVEQKERVKKAKDEKTFGELKAIGENAKRELDRKKVEEVRATYSSVIEKSPMLNEYAYEYEDFTFGNLPKLTASLVKALKKGILIGDIDFINELISVVEKLPEKSRTGKIVFDGNIPINQSAVPIEVEIEVENDYIRLEPKVKEIKQIANNFINTGEFDAGFSHPPKELKDVYGDAITYSRYLTDLVRFKKDREKEEAKKGKKVKKEKPKKEKPLIAYSTDDAENQLLNDLDNLGYLPDWVKNDALRDMKKKGKGIVDNTKLYQQVKDAADIIYDKPSAYKSGFIVKKYKEMGGTYSGAKGELNEQGLSRWFKENWKDIGNKEYPVFRPTKRITKDTPLTPDEIKPSNLKKQIALKQVIKGDANLPPFLPLGKVNPNKAELNGAGVHSLGQSANNISESDEVYKFSNPKKVQELANKYLGKDVIIYRSISKAKKYMVYNPNTKKWVHFGQMGYEDFTKHKDPKRQKNYLTRTANIKGDWKDDKYSPNNLSRNLLW
jgi:hypothetical protein